jgi:nucleoside phosphorylase
MLTLIIASNFEAKPFIKDLKKVAENIFEGDYRVIISGTGLVNMAAATVRTISELNFNKIINLGIAGAVNDHFTAGQVIKAKKFNIFSSVDIPDSSQNIWENSYPSLGQSNDISLYTSLHPVWNEQDKNKLKELNADLLDMEAYAFAKVCNEHQVDFEVIKAISDSLHKKSQKEFLVNAQKAIEELYQYFHKNYL